MKKFLISTLIVLLGVTGSEALAFCGFYVARADVSLFNTTSQVIIARKDQRTTVTMSNDFKGDVRDFAMVVPVPQILKESDIRVIDSPIFEKLDAYSGPRLVEYHDYDPCPRYLSDVEVLSAVTISAEAVEVEEDAPADFGSTKDIYKVTIEAEYKIGEYDIVILSAEESGGLERWLIDNGYKIPPKAKRLLKPYIRNGLKFFVVKVDLTAFDQKGSTDLRPIQISYEDRRFMLPIRLGMANAEEEQDMMVYVLTENGRAETVNYRMAEIPTDLEIPLPVKDKFGAFFTALFEKNREWEGEDVIFLEYAWDLSGQNGVKCDPCPSPPPIVGDLIEAGVDWLTPFNNGNYAGNLFFTRMHVRYDRANFPQDLIFTETPNRDNFQGRYIIHHPAPGDWNCENGLAYWKTLKRRRANEIFTLEFHTGWNGSDYMPYLNEYAKPWTPNQEDGSRGEIDDFPGNFDLENGFRDLWDQNIEKAGGGEPTGFTQRTSLWFLFLVILAGIMALILIRPDKRSKTGNT